MDALPESISVSASLLSQLFLYLQSRQVDVDKFLRSLEIDSETVKSPDARLPVETYLLIQDEAANYINDPYLGLHMGEFAEAGSWSILGYVMMNCKNLGEAFEKSGRYSKIIGNMIEAQAELRLNRVRIIFFTPPNVPEQTRHCYDSTLSSSIRMMRSLTGRNVCPHEVTFTSPEPMDKSEYERIFQCPVRFNQKDTSMTIDISVAALPIRMANPALLAQFEQYAQDFLANMERKDEYTQAVTKILLAHLDDENLTIEKVAKKMSISVRTLQNYLQSEGVVFSDLLREVRDRLARQYLRQNYTVEQITYLLGFSEPSVFRKAFKKWAGVTPREYRERASSILTR